MGIYVCWGAMNGMRECCLTSQQMETVKAMHIL